MNKAAFEFPHNLREDGHELRDRHLLEVGGLGVGDRVRVVEGAGSRLPRGGRGAIIALDGPVTVFVDFGDGKGIACWTDEVEALGPVDLLAELAYVRLLPQGAGGEPWATAWR